MIPAFANRLGALKRAATAASVAGSPVGSGVIRQGQSRIARRPRPGDVTQAESAQYEAGEEGQEPIGGDGLTGKAGRMPVGQITPRRPRRPF